jgi:hypothetical protein
MKTPIPNSYAFTCGLALAASAMFAFSSPAQSISGKTQPLSVAPTTDVSGTTDDAQDQEADWPRNSITPSPP